MKLDLKKQAKELPNNPGIYIYRDIKGSVIYVGKAKNLKNRVGSYFNIDLDPFSKTAALVNNIESLEYIEVTTEFEALILEAELIKKYYPKYNIMLKDDKTFLNVVIHESYFETNFGNIKYLKVTTARNSDLNKIPRKKVIFGPYPDGRTAKEILRMLRKIFPYVDCSAGKFSRYYRLKSPCLFGHIGLCPAPCVNYSKQDIKKINDNINAIRKILGGKSSDIIKDAKKKMAIYSKRQDFESAANLRDIISKFDYLRQDFKIPNEYLENPYLVTDIAQNSLNEIYISLPIISVPPKRIECYDISNISGTAAVASLVVASNGKIDKSQYKRFKIKYVKGPNDFLMMKEVLTRRLKHYDWPKPDLIVLDGGRGQLSVVLNAMKEVNLSIPCVGIAKREETLVYRNNDVFYELKLPKDNPGLKLIIMLRNEAHRFAQAYHHKLRLNSIK